MDISQTLSIIPPKINFVFRNLKRTKKTKTNPVRWRSISTLVNVYDWKCFTKEAADAQQTLEPLWRFLS